MLKLLSLFSLILLVSCYDYERASEQELQSAMNGAKFDKKLIADIHQYDELKNFLQQYGDTIISYVNSKNYVTKTDSTDKTDSTKEECIEFYYPKVLNDLPAFLQSKFDSIYSKFDKKSIQDFEICPDRQITIKAREDEGEGSYQLYFTHMLIWNNNNRGDKWDDKYKDTLINDNCVYRIGLWERTGR